ncbi:MAG TPA: UvrD-helicase domain-containing protein [Acidimicrobiales bacterium]|nr:UvrD-helicase domain-containing protein [Acidimicrobiales bacterium]
MGPRDVRPRPPLPAGDRWGSVGRPGAASAWYATRSIPIEEVDIAGILRTAGVAAVHRRRPPVPEPPRLAGGRSKGLHLAVTDGGVFVIEACPWRWRRSDRGALELVDADAAVAELARDADAVEEALAATGLSPNEIRPVLISGYAEGAVFTYGRVWLAGPERLDELIHAPGQRLSAPLQATAIERLATVYAGDPATGTEPPPAPDHYPLEAGQWSPKPLLVASVATEGRLEPWMQRLHPDQMQAVRRSHRGPALVRGASGTGKTVVAVHRAAYLAERLPGRILVTTPVRAFVGVLASQYRRLSPTTLGRVEFATLHGFALRVLADRGIACNVDGPSLESAFQRAWTRVGGLGLGAWAPPEYWWEEILTVIKGRGLDGFDQYLRAARPGRSVPLPGPRRRDLWELHLAYAEELARRDLQDWYDVVLLARDSLRKEPLEPGYRAVIADEIGDVPLTGLQLLHLLVGDRTDGLLLVGDAAPSNGPGPVALREAGIDVGGRSTVMRTVYRDPGRLLEAAVAVVGVPEMDEPELPFVVPEPHSDRDGKPVRHDVAVDRAAHDCRLLSRLRDDIADGVPRGEIAVLCPSARSVTHYRRLLVQEGLPVAELGRSSSVSDGAIKIGTISSAADRAFTAVFLPAGDPLRAVQGPDQLKRARTERFLAMTAAQERLWVGTVDPQPT